MSARAKHAKHNTSQLKTLRSWIAAGAAAALAAGMLVFAGLGAQTALAAPNAPEASTYPVNQPLVAGEAGALSVTFTNANGTVGEFNLSAMLVLPKNVAVTNTGGFGIPTQVYTSDDGALPGVTAHTAAECAAMGLIEAGAGKCAVPTGQQLLIFENFSDLPATASTTLNVNVLPDANAYEPGVNIPYVFTGFTSDDPNLLPVFPGSSSKALNGSHSSGPGIAESEIRVEAFRVSKSEPSPENELLRGAHDHQTVYTLNIAHTGEGDVTGAKVVDYLPAALEYLGSGQIDNTEAANGAGSTEEYPGSTSMSGKRAQPASWFPEESIVTVQLSAAEADELGLPGAGVYTKVTWDLESLLAAGGSSTNIGTVTTTGIAQSFPETAGTAGVITLQYVAAVPLFENTYIADSFDENIASAHGALAQGSNLDNNSGPSTRHGAAIPEGGAGWLPDSLTNTAIASGDYTLKTPRPNEPPVYRSSATGSHTVEVVDVRLLKTVDNSEFVQGGLAEFTLTISTSEYVEAELADAPGSSSSVRPNRLVDDFADGICPAFPADVDVTQGASMIPGLPNLRIGNPATGEPSDPSHANMTSAAWSAALGEALADCAFPSAETGTKLEGASLTGIAYDPATGRFFLDLWIDSMGQSDTKQIVYTTLQNKAYTENEGQPGGTSSGDVISNYAEVLMTTTPTADTAGVINGNGGGVGGEFRAEENSQAQMSAIESGLTKFVLPRSEGVPTAAEITGAGLTWEEDLAPEPFAAGDEVWYRIDLKLPDTADVRNPKLTDYLPQGVELSEGWPHSDGNGGFTDYRIVPPADLPDYGSCKTTTQAEWLAKYAGNASGTPQVAGNLLTWNLGSTECVTGNTSDRFLPIASSFTVYVKATVAGTSAVDTHDLPQNLAKYQQQARINEDGEREIFFLRDAAEIELVTTPQLIKGIETNEFAGISGFVTSGDSGWKGTAPGPNYPAGSNAGNEFWSNVDGEYAVQGNEITFRIDVQSPTGNLRGSVATRDYVVWDVLPAGITAADVQSNFRAVTVEVADGAISEAPVAASNIDFKALNPGDTGYPSDIQTALNDRSVIIWNLNGVNIPGTQVDGVTHGFSLLYTIVVPSDTTGDRRDALLEQQYTNTAAIVQYDSVTQTSVDDSATTLVPFGDKTLRNNGLDPVDLPGGAKAVPQLDTVDDSNFMIPNAAIRKMLVATEIPSVDPAISDPQNGAGVIVQGEYATYDISVTIPANTTVRNGVLADNGTLAGTGGGTGVTPSTPRYQVESAEVTATNGQTIISIESDEAADNRNFKLNTNTGKLIFPEYYQNATDEAQTFTVQLVLWVKDIDASNPQGSGTPSVPNADRPQIPHNKGLRNTATFDSKNVAGTANSRVTDTADVTYREPDPTLSKITVGEVGGADGNVTFRLVAENSADRPALYDSIVYDCLPAGFSIPEPNFVSSQGDVSVIDGGCTTTGTGSNTRVTAGGGSGTLIAWEVGKLNGNTTARLDFTAKIDAAAGGGASYTNRAQITGYTLPAGVDGLPDAEVRRGDRVSGAERAVNISNATVAKSVATPNGLGSAPIGETIRYTVTATLPAHANFYDVLLTDTLPTGVTFAGNQNVTFSGWAAGTEPTVTGPTNPNSPALAWTLNSDDIALHTGIRTINIEFDAKLTTAVNAVKPRNTAKLSWNVTNGAEGTRREAPLANADVTILNPALQIVKKVDGLDSITRNPDASFDYTLTVSQTRQGNTPAHAITVRDVVPTGVIVDEASITPAGTLSGAGPNGGGTITWELTGPLNPAGSATATSIELGYSAEFADSTTLSATALENVANVTHFESFAQDGRSYDPPLTGTGSIRDTATVTPLFPMVDPVKTVTNPVAGADYGLAYVDTPFNWTLTITNNGRGIAKTVDVVDTLPANWSYVTGSALVNGVALADPTPGTADGKTTLTWTTAQLQAAISTLPPLAGGGSFTITFDAKPNAEAIDAPGTGLPTGGAVHTNTVAVTHVTDTQDEERNASGDYTGADSTANAYIAEIDLQLQKAAIGGTSADITLSNGETLPQGSWLAGGVAGTELVKANAEAGTSAVTYTQPQWQLTITNHGPDASVGAFEIDEQQVLPAGVTVDGWRAQYFAAGSTIGVDMPLAVIGSGADLNLTVGDATTRLNAAGTDRIVVTANVSIPAGTTATDDELKNSATVVGETFEREVNKVPPHRYPNTAEAGKALSTIADLAIVKAFVPTTGARNAGDLINWNLTVTNIGPDHSLSTSGDGNQIVVVDDVPVEIVDPAVVVGSLPTGWTMTQDGQKFTFTLTPEAQLDVDASVTFSFSGRIGGNVAADTEIVNTATVTAGKTPDPYTPNNESTDSTDPLTAHTSVAATKQRVIFDDDSQTWILATGEVTAGESVSYRLQLTNTGNYVPARGVTLTDTLPSYLSLDSWTVETPSSGWNFSQTGQTLTFTNSDAVIAPGGTASVILTATVAADHRAAIVNTECVTTGNLDPNQSTADDCATSTTSSDKSVDWELLKSHVAPAQDQPANAGEIVRYRLVLNNHGPSASDGPITITDVLPAGFSYAGNVVATGATLSAASVTDQTITWTATGPFAVGAGVVTVEFDALVAAHTEPGVYENQARVDGPADEPDTNPNNNDDDDEIPVIRDARMHLDKQVLSIDDVWGETAEHAAGTTVTWRVKITNDGPSAAAVTFSDDLALAPGVTLTELDGGTDWTCDLAAQECVYAANNGLFPVTVADESNAGWITITTTLAANVPPTAAPGLVNWGKIVWVDNTFDPTLPEGGNSARDDANITTIRSADLGLVKQVRETAPDGAWINADSEDTAGTVTAGLSTHFRVVVTNEGPSNAVAPLIVRDQLPAGATFEGLVTSPEWTAVYDPADHSVTFTRGENFGGLLVDGTPLIIEYEVSFDASLEAGDVLLNTAAFDAETLDANGDSNPDNNSDPANVVVDRQIDLGIVKGHEADTVRIGDELPFTIDVTNYGPSEASGITVTDTVPAGLEVISEVGPLLDALGDETGWTIDSIVLAVPGDDTVDPEIPADLAGGATVTASYVHPLAPQESATPLVIDTLVTASAYDTVTNVVVVEANEPEPDPDTEHPNRAEDPVIVPPLVTLITEKTAVGEFQVGQTGTFEITVVNLGPTTDPGPITVTDVLPAGLSYHSSPALPAGVTIDVVGNTVTWTITEGLAVDEIVALTLNVNVHQGAYPEVTNTVVVDTPSELTPDSIVTDDATVKVQEADPLATTGGSAVGYLAMLAALLMLGGGVVAATRRGGSRNSRELNTAAR